MMMHLVALILLLLLSNNAYAFCGFYVGKADSSLFNRASQVVMVRDENRTVISMMNDYEGNLSQFAMVIPVPSILKREQINVGRDVLFSRIDSFTAPRLVEYFDRDPCMRLIPEVSNKVALGGEVQPESVSAGKNRGVKVEAEYTIGEYDIVLLSAKESNGLELWLQENGYRIPKGARKALSPYIKQKLKFFVAKVNLKEQAKTGFTKLRPLQIAFESDKFMLPIRLGIINAKGPQELFIYMITKKGRVESTNYQTVKLPSDMDLPVHIKDDFPKFYRSMFDEQVRKQNMRTIFTEYFWDMSWCDPCAAEPLSSEELGELGVYWVKDSPMQRGGAQNVKVTRLHLRYTNETFPSDLMFHETSDTQNFQARYVLRHPWSGKSGRCEEEKRYFAGLPERFDKEAQSLANLTGWNIADIRKKIDQKYPTSGSGGSTKKNPWWKGLWKQK